MNGNLPTSGIKIQRWWVTAKRNLSHTSHVVSVPVYRCLKREQDCGIVVFVFSDLLCNFVPSKPFDTDKEPEKNCQELLFSTKQRQQSKFNVGRNKRCLLAKIDLHIFEPLFSNYQYVI